MLYDAVFFATLHVDAKEFNYLDQNLQDFRIGRIPVPFC